MQHYRDQGATKIVELGKPYDLRVTLAGVERHVEVKGSSQLLATVELTRNEVSHAKTYTPMDLVVVDDIRWSRNAAGEVATTGGALRIWSNWTPVQEDLSPTKYAYNLPHGGSVPQSGEG